MTLSFGHRLRAIVRLSQLLMVSSLSCASTTSLEQALEDAHKENKHLRAEIDRLRAERDRAVRAVVGRDRKLEATNEVDRLRADLAETRLLLDQYRKRMGFLKSIQGAVARLSGELIWLNLGAADGVEQGQVFHLRRDEQYVGRMQITLVEPRQSAGKLRSRVKEARVGDIAYTSPFD